VAHKLPGVHSDPDILGGTPVFIATRVPVSTLLDYLEHGLRSIHWDQPQTARRFATRTVAAVDEDRAAVEFHRAGRIGKSLQTYANAGEHRQTLNRCSCER
jgi:hypothetical protein